MTSALHLGIANLVQRFFNSFDADDGQIFDILFWGVGFRDLAN